MSPSAWSDQVEVALAGATGNDPTYSMGDLKREIETGTATLYVVFANDERLGWLVLWIDDFGSTKEMVIQSGAAIGREPRALQLAMPAVEKLARAHGCLTIRAHVNDGGRFRNLKRNGFIKSETVMRKAL